MELFDGLDSAEAWIASIDLLLKLGIAAVLGGAVGWEREIHGRPAGIRTHMLIGLGAMLFSEVSKGFGPGDPGRIAAQVVAGIGFLGAGTIMRTGVEIKGLTSAASIWAVAGIGMAVSVGGTFLVVAIAATLLTLFTLAVVDSIERRIAPSAQQRTLRLSLASSAALAGALAAVRAAGAEPIAVRVVSTEPTWVVHIELPRGRADPLAEAATAEGCIEAGWLD